METLTGCHRAPAHPEVRRRQLLRRVPAADRLVRQPGTAVRERRPVRTESPEIASNPAHPNADTALIDMHPATAGDWTDAAMDVGQVFSDRLRGITIKDVAQDATGVTLAITVPGDTLPPSAPSGLSAVADGTTVVLRWSAAIDDFSVDDYVVKRDGAQVGTPVTTDFTDSGLVPGTTVGYTVAAVDAGGNVGPAAGVSLVIPDTTPPGTPPRVTAKVTKAGRVQVAWGAAPDNGRVARYRIRRAGRLIGTTTGRAYIDRSPKPGRGSSVSYSVVAVDLAGNAGPPGKARPVRAALLRRLAVSNFRVASVTLGAHALVRLKGTVSDASASCLVRIGRGAWQACRAKANGALRRPPGRERLGAGDPLAARPARARHARHAQRALSFPAARSGMPDLRLGMAHTAPPAEIVQRGCGSSRPDPRSPPQQHGSCCWRFRTSRARAPARAPRSSSAAGTSWSCTPTNVTDRPRSSQCSSKACATRPCARPTASGSSLARGCGSRARSRTARSWLRTASRPCASSRPRRTLPATCPPRPRPRPPRSCSCISRARRSARCPRCPRRHPPRRRWTPVPPPWRLTTRSRRTARSRSRPTSTGRCRSPSRLRRAATASPTSSRGPSSR